MPARSSWCSIRSRSAPQDRRQSARAIQAELNRRLSKLQDAFVVAVLPPPVRGIGTAGGFRMMIEDRAGRGPAALQQAAAAVTARAAKTAGVSQVFTLFENSTPQVYLNIDRTKAQLLGINVQDVFNALQVYIGSSYVNDFNLFGRTFRVTAQAREQDRRNVADVLKIRVRNANGDTVPLGSFTTVSDISGPYRVPRYNLYPAAEIDGAAAAGYSQGQAIAVMDNLAAETLPDGFATEWTTLAFQQIRAGNTAMFAFVLAVVFVFLVLAAQYESLTLPLAVILIVPMCLVAAITGVILRGQDNNILTQVGFVVLIGLAAKNAILIVEFARQLEDQGRSRWQAAVEATRLRLRPILMTSFAFILGVTPLVWAIGAGAELRQALGTAVFFGMIGVTAFGLIFTPVFYVIARWIAHLEPRRGKKRQCGARGGVGVLVIRAKSHRERRREDNRESDWAAAATHAELEQNERHFERRASGRSACVSLAAVLPVVGSAASNIASLFGCFAEAHQACNSVISLVPKPLSRHPLHSLPLRRARSVHSIARRLESDQPTETNAKVSREPRR